MSFIWESTVASILSFSILYWLLDRYAFGKLFSIMEQRRELMKNQLDEAASTRDQALAYIQEQKKVLEHARNEAHDMIENCKKTGKKQAEEILLHAKNEALHIKEESIRDIQRERDRAVEDLRTELGTAAVHIASKIIREEVKPNKIQQQLVHDFINEVGKKS